MADYELYGDYNGAGDEEQGPPPHRGVVWTARLIRFVVICILIGTCGLLLFRIFFSGYYPKEITRLHYTDALAAYAESVDGALYAETQKIRVPYEDAQTGYFTADNLILVREGGALQCTVRLNRQALKDIAEAEGIEPLTMSESTFRFVLEDNTGGTYESSYIGLDQALMYHYVKLCFDGVNFAGIAWMRLSITVPGVTYGEEKEPFYICVYENNDKMYTFSEYHLSKEEEYRHE